ncbi:hypothetical protein V1522DRAFT_400201 [Lipomyces starkeyi]
MALSEIISVYLVLAAVAQTSSFHRIPSDGTPYTNPARRKGTPDSIRGSFRIRSGRVRPSDLYSIGGGCVTFSLRSFDHGLSTLSICRV